MCVFDPAIVLGSLPNRNCWPHAQRSMSKDASASILEHVNRALQTLSQRTHPPVEEWPARSCAPLHWHAPQRGSCTALGVIPETRCGVRGEKNKSQIGSPSRPDADPVYAPAARPCTSSMSLGMETPPKGSGAPKLLREVREGTVAWVSEGVARLIF